jgi:hypothetical protein
MSALNTADRTCLTSTRDTWRQRAQRCCQALKSRYLHWYERRACSRRRRRLLCCGVGELVRSGGENMNARDEQKNRLHLNFAGFVRRRRPSTRQRGNLPWRQAHVVVSCVAKRPGTPLRRDIREPGVAATDQWPLVLPGELLPLLINKGLLDVVPRASFPSCSRCRRLSTQYNTKRPKRN